MPKASKDSNPRTDIILAIHTKHVDNILTRRKNHEFRGYLLPAVRRMWLYETAPTKAIRYVMTVGPAKRPGKIAEDGLKNDAFNRGETAKHKYAYPIVQVHKLDAPLSLADAKQRGLMANAPQSFIYCSEAMLAVAPSMARSVVFDLTTTAVEDETSRPRSSASVAHAESETRPDLTATEAAAEATAAVDGGGDARDGAEPRGAAMLSKREAEESLTEVVSEAGTGVASKRVRLAAT